MINWGLGFGAGVDIYMDDQPYKKIRGVRTRVSTWS